MDKALGQSTGLWMLLRWKSRTTGENLDFEEEQTLTCSQYVDGQLIDQWMGQMNVCMDEGEENAFHAPWLELVIHKAGQS
ncbi:hypothetical protein PAMP_010550 [Pampus punctatissimus]